jgi:hypothetical protein
MSVMTKPQFTGARATPVGSCATKACCHQLALNSGESATSLRVGFTPSVTEFKVTYSLLVSAFTTSQAASLFLLNALIEIGLTSR